MEAKVIIDILKSNFKHSPTSSQKLLLQRFSEFLSTESKKDIFILRGYAGTGKTTLISSVVKSSYKLRTKIVLLAPTGRAAKVMGAYSGMTALTIHKKIYRPPEDVVGDHFLRANNPHKDTLFIVDEASMIGGNQVGMYSSSLLHDLIEYIYEQEGCKLLMVGDVAQLPPVHEDLSPALIPKFFNLEFHLKVDGVELIDVVRQKLMSGILYNATDLREKIETENFSVQLDTSFDDVIAISGMDLQEELDSCISNFGEDNVLVICRSNKRANLFNQQIRTRVLWKEERLCAGDLLMVVKNNYHWLGKESKAGFIANGDTIEVLSIRRVEEMYGYEFADVTMRLLDYPNEKDLEVKIVLNSIDTETSSLGKDFLEDLFLKVYEDYWDEPDGGKRMIKVKNDPYYNALQIKFAYAVTCHKSQGGQWPVVFIDQGYLTDDMIDTNFLRWLYTAVTRATEKLYLVNFNEQFIK